MIYIVEPKDFNSKFEIVSCFIEYDGEILLLHRQDHKPQGDTWGIPAGKVNKNENLLETIIREVKEETALDIPASQISYFDRVYVRYPSYDFVYHMFHTKLATRGTPKINHIEHKNFRWIPPKDALDLPLIPDEDACIKLFYKI